MVDEYQEARRHQCRKEIEIAERKARDDEPGYERPCEIGGIDESEVESAHAPGDPFEAVHFRFEKEIKKGVYNYLHAHEKQENNKTKIN